jgi:hypothetical protein
MQKTDMAGWPETLKNNISLKLFMKLCFVISSAVAGHIQSYKNKIVGFSWKTPDSADDRAGDNCSLFSLNVVI